ncbi:DUF3467 domain-containing protein [Bacillus cereus]|uniref:DUF3467 domain-containing protein n=1 Tax=Bacillus cereus TaxID=1396 RepID=UPI000BF6D04E|nr:DUF3467 domain-containing protein [Bacillus cereus]MDG1570122.1 DUF3467 domain-containing protein [Bacillus cereus]PFK43087.1 hypothetical protein COJ20_09340 [Bacillus cereus]PFT89978.1 hypothetical protein COK66_22795 [Bacillus cereus]
MIKNVVEVAENPNTETQNATKIAEYSNSVNVSTNIYDFTLRFEQKNPSGSTEICSIIMSPEHTKVLANVLMNSVQEYEEKYGTIPTKSK